MQQWRNCAGTALPACPERAVDIPRRADII